MVTEKEARADVRISKRTFHNLGSEEWLDSTHINIFQTLLRRVNYSIGGLYLSDGSFQKKIRNHMNKCVCIDGAVSAFPEVKKTKIVIKSEEFLNQRPVTEMVDVHCYCRRPEHIFDKKTVKEKMVDCDRCGEWFHKMCIEKDEANSIFSVGSRNAKVAFSCNKCKKT